MREHDEYRFIIDAYSPDTIPMLRLAEYMVELGRLLANQDRVHFERLEKGSTVLVSRVEREAAPKVANRLRDVSHADAPPETGSIVVRLNSMLRDDNAVGALWRASEHESAQVLAFPGRNLPRPKRIGPIAETAVIDGELVRIGGRDHTAHAQIQDAEGRTWSGELSRELATRLAPHLYKGKILRVEGDARWQRSEEGVWELISFRIHDFKVFAEESLTEVVARLRGIGLQGQDNGIH